MGGRSALASRKPGGACTATEPGFVPRCQNVDGHLRKGHHRFPPPSLPCGTQYQSTEKKSSPVSNSLSDLKNIQSIIPPCLHRHHAGRLRGEELKHLPSAQLLAERNRPVSPSTVKLKAMLRQIDPNNANLFHGCLLLQEIKLRHHLATLRCRREGPSIPSLHDMRCRTPCNTRFRLAGCAFAGRESNPLDRDERFQFTAPPLKSLAWGNNPSGPGGS